MRSISAVDKRRADALVFFGATGDLASKKIIPALQAMSKRGHLDVPVVGVGRRPPEEFRAKVKESLEAHGGLDPAAFARFNDRLKYVRGDFKDKETSTAIRKEVGGARRPAYYLAIPPSQFPIVLEQLSCTGCAEAAVATASPPI